MYPTNLLLPFTLAAIDVGIDELLCLNTELTSIWLDSSLDRYMYATDIFSDGSLVIETWTQLL